MPRLLFCKGPQDRAKQRARAILELGIPQTARSLQSFSDQRLSPNPSGMLPKEIR